MFGASAQQFAAAAAVGFGKMVQNKDEKFAAQRDARRVDNCQKWQF